MAGHPALVPLPDRVATVDRPGSDQAFGVAVEQVVARIDHPDQLAIPDVGGVAVRPYVHQTVDDPVPAIFLRRVGADAVHLRLQSGVIHVERLLRDHAPAPPGAQFARRP